jgi:hypothetical protein
MYLISPGSIEGKTRITMMLDNDVLVSYRRADAQGIGYRL